MGISFRMCEIVQQVEFMKYNKEEIEEILKDKNVKDYAFILHDKDDGVKSHYHIALRFDNPRKSDQIAKWFDIPENCVCKIKGGWKDVLKYLIHENAKEKYQYSLDEVTSNFDFEKGKEEGLGRKEEIINLIATGEIREYNIAEKLTPVEFDKYSSSIKNAFAYRQKILLGVKDREMECIFITGTSGSGKTTYAKKLCKNKGYSYFVSGSSNDPFDGYEGQDAIILDDLRGSVFTFADLLKITDNHTSSTVKSRYKNKIMECKLLIITSILEISNFYNTVFESSQEPLLQFERRMQTYVKMNVDSMTIQYFDKEEQCYMQAWTGLNPVSKMHKKEKEVQQRLAFIEDLFGDDLKIEEEEKTDCFYFNKLSKELENHNQVIWEEIDG